MELDRQGKEQKREVIEDFMLFVEKVQKESDARRAVSGEPASPVLIGANPEEGQLVVFGLDAQGADQSGSGPEPREP